MTQPEDFSALHYASFNGNLEMCQMLIDEGADKYVNNKVGLNLLHVAAQGGRPSTLYYFHKILGLNILEQDHKGSTTLHWAIYSLEELATVYILAWLDVNDLSQRDNEGFTAMHLAIRSCEQL